MASVEISTPVLTESIVILWKYFILDTCNGKVVCLLNIF